MSTSEVLQSSSSTDTTTCISRNGDAKLPGENTVSLTKEGTNQDENAVAVSNDPTVTPEEGEGPVSVAVCGVTGAGDKVCVTVCSEEEEKRQERGRNEDILPNGKPASASKTVVVYDTYNCTDEIIFVVLSISTTTSTQLVILFHSLWQAESIWI